MFSDQDVIDDVTWSPPYLLSWGTRRMAVALISDWLLAVAGQLRHAWTCGQQKEVGAGPEDAHAQLLFLFNCRENSHC
jgi:hypothetical protein